MNCSETWKNFRSMFDIAGIALYIFCSGSGDPQVLFVWGPKNFTWVLCPVCPPLFWILSGFSQVCNHRNSCNHFGRNCECLRVFSSGLLLGLQLLVSICCDSGSFSVPLHFLLGVGCLRTSNSVCDLEFAISFQ